MLADAYSAIRPRFSLRPMKLKYRWARGAICGSRCHRTLPIGYETNSLGLYFPRAEDPSYDSCNRGIDHQNSWRPARLHCGRWSVRQASTNNTGVGAIDYPRYHLKKGHESECLSHHIVAVSQAFEQHLLYCCSGPAARR